MSSKDFGSGLFEYLEMGFTEGMNYVLFKNPVSSTMIDSLKVLVDSIPFKSTSSSPNVKLPPAIENLPVSKLVFIGSPFVRLAGLYGAAAVIFGAYGYHTYYVKEGFEDQKRVFQTANNYHFIHSLALLGTPLCRHPKAVGSLFSIGMLLFCGASYYYVTTGKKEFSKLTPLGGTCLILGWLFLML